LAVGCGYGRPIFPCLTWRILPPGRSANCGRQIELALAEDRAEAIVLGCAGMADLAHALQQEYGVPVVDGVSAAVKQAEALVAQRLTTSKRGSYVTPLAKTYAGAMAEFSPKGI
jgi:allantoin racemase